MVATESKEENSILTTDTVEEFHTNFNKVALENQMLQLEGVLTRNDEGKSEVIQGVFREVHSLKGTAAILEIEPLTSFLHIFEDMLGIISRNILEISGVKKVEIFDYLLQSLDLVERLALALRDDPAYVLKDNKQLFGFYIRMIVDARDVIGNPDQYFEFTKLDENLF